MCARVHYIDEYIYSSTAYTHIASPSRIQSHRRLAVVLRIPFIYWLLARTMCSRHFHGIKTHSHRCVLHTRTRTHCVCFCARSTLPPSSPPPVWSCAAQRSREWDFQLLRVLTLKRIRLPVVCIYTWTHLFLDNSHGISSFLRKPNTVSKSNMPRAFIPSWVIY